jgi:hypothetical protein
MMMNAQGDQAPAKWQTMFKKFENSSTKAVAEQSMGSQTLLGCYGICQEILTENSNMRRTAPSRRARSHAPENHQSL